MIGFMTTIAISMVVAFIGNKLTKGQMPGGFWVAFLIAVFGSWFGYMKTFRGIEPSLENLSIIPSVIGSVIFISIFVLFRKVISQVKI